MHSYNVTPSDQQSISVRYPLTPSAGYLGVPDLLCKGLYHLYSDATFWSSWASFYGQLLSIVPTYRTSQIQMAVGVLKPYAQSFAHDSIVLRSRALPSRQSWGGGDGYLEGLLCIEDSIEDEIRAESLLPVRGVQQFSFGVALSCNRRLMVFGSLSSEVS